MNFNWGGGGAGAGGDSKCLDPGHHQLSLSGSEATNFTLNSNLEKIFSRVSKKNVPFSFSFLVLL